MTASEKILLLSSEFPPGPGGIGNHAYNLAKHLNLNGIMTDVLTVSDFVTDDEANAFDRKQDFKIQRHRRYANRLKTYSERLGLIRRIAAEGNYNIIILSGMSSLLASLLIRKGSSKFVAIAHGGEVNVPGGMERKMVDRALQRCDLVIPVSKFTASMMKTPLPTERVKIIPNGFDIENYSEISFNRSAPKPGELNLISVGSVWPRKGHHNVLRAFPKIKESFPELKYHIIGRKADMSKVESFLHEDFMKDVILHGQIESAEVQRLLKGSDVFILLSELQESGDFEGFGIAAIEANYFGLPSVGSLSSGLEDAIDNGSSGILVDHKSDEQITQALKTIVDDYENFSINSVEWAKKHHWSNVVKDYISAFRNIAD